MAKKAEAVKASSHEVEQGKVCAILSYLLIGIIWYFVDEKMKKNSYVKFHAKQGLVLLIASIAYSIALGILFSIIFAALFFGGGVGLFLILHWLYYVPLVFTIIGIINAVNGKNNELPIIGKFGEKFNI